MTEGVIDHFIKWFTNKVQKIKGWKIEVILQDLTNPMHWAISQMSRVVFKALGLILIFFITGLDHIAWENQEFRIKNRSSLLNLVTKGRHKKNNCRFGENCTIGGRGSEKLLNFHHLQMMKNIEGGVGLRVTFHYFIEPNYD